MPEFYAEPMKDRKYCSVCKKTAKAKGKKVLLTCIKCHAITYCGRECQMDDWERHEWNCVPVMVTEIPGKGRGLVAARDIGKGELIFKDQVVIKLAADAEGQFVGPDFMRSLKQQIDCLPSEAQAQYFKLMPRENDVNIYHVNRNDWEVLKLFLANCKTYMPGRSQYGVLYLNIALVNQSCVPNATNRGLRLRKTEGEEDFEDRELLAIKNIRKGEEISICYFEDAKQFGSIPRKRKTALRKELGFDCKCPVCLGQVPIQEKTLKKLIELHNKLNPKPSDWKREAGLWSRIVDLTLELNIGDPCEKVFALDAFVKFSHLARDKDLVKKALDMWRHFAEETKIKNVLRIYEAREECLVEWSKEFRSNIAPKKKEIDAFLNCC